jgi:hypothetical protein
MRGPEPPASQPRGRTPPSPSWPSLRCAKRVVYGGPPWGAWGGCCAARLGLARPSIALCLASGAECGVRFPSGSYGLQTHACCGKEEAHSANLRLSRTIGTGWFLNLVFLFADGEVRASEETAFGPVPRRQHQAQEAAHADSHRGSRKVLLRHEDAMYVFGTHTRPPLCTRARICLALSTDTLPWRHVGCPGRRANPAAPSEFSGAYLSPPPPQICFGWGSLVCVVAPNPCACTPLGRTHEEEDVGLNEFGLCCCA